VALPCTKTICGPVPLQRYERLVPSLDRWRARFKPFRVSDLHLSASPIFGNSGQNAAEVRLARQAIQRQSKNTSGKRLVDEAETSPTNITVVSQRENIRWVMKRTEQ
jgi:hypothetical protein